MNNRQKVLGLANRISETAESLRFSETIDMPRNYKKLYKLVSEIRALATQPIAEPVEDVVEAIVRDVAELPDRNSPEDWPEAMLVTADELTGILRDRLAQPQTEDWRIGYYERWNSRAKEFGYAGLADCINSAQPQRKCGCGLDNCRESWEPGCGLGTSIEHAVPVEPQRQDQAIGRIDEGDEGAFVEFYPDRDLPLGAEVFLRPQRQGRAVAELNVRCVAGAQEHVTAELTDWGRLLPDGKYNLYTEQPASAAVADVALLLREASEVLASISGSGVELPENWRWPLVDELAGLSYALAAAPDRSQSGGGA